MDAEVVFQAIIGSSDAGLNNQQVKERQQLHGRNQIIKKPTDSVVQLLWRQINNPLIWVLLGAAGLAIALGKVTDGLVVLSVVLINAVIGFI
jgi:Ca2+-transporting ATPase